ncbi:ABC transporter ATP-binding protein, partial [Streptomyces olivaceus]|uniref:ABC transporter ATP-binding protein n=1 Tax=Streptomyces olivaceus TaxID=47716 RepID=UPI003663869D
RGSTGAPPRGRGGRPRTPGPPAQVREARDRVLALFPRLAERTRQAAGLLSGGEQQMLAIGRALMAAPRLLLLDEPSLGLAPMMVDRIAEVVREINAGGTAVLLVEQNAGMALSLAERAHVLEVGEVRLSGDAAELARTDAVRRLYLGETADGAGGLDGRGAA